MGKEAIRLLKFAIAHPGWHSVAPGQPKALRALRALEAHGLIKVIRWANNPRQSCQFSLDTGEHVAHEYRSNLETAKS